MTGFAMAFWVLLDAAVVGLAVLILRAGYRRLQDPQILLRGFALEGDEGDVMTHLVAIDLVRRNRNRIPRETPQFLCSTEFDYPALFHKLLSYIPRTWLERGEWLISPGFEAIHAALVYLGSWYIFTQVGSGTADDARGLALLAVAAWAVTPLLTYNPRRGSVLGERCFGYIVGHAFLFFVAVAMATGQLAWLVPAALAFTIAAASSKFAFQAMVFIALALSVVRLELLPLLALAFSFVVAVLASFGYVLRVLGGTLRHSRFYRSFLVHIHDYTRSFSTKDLRRAAQLLLRGRWREALATARRHPIHRLPALVPWLVTFALFLALSSQDSPLISVLISWTFAALLVTALTATDSLKFLGEAERYMEFALLPIIVLSVMTLPLAGPTALFVIFVYCLFRLGTVYTTRVRLSSAAPETIELAHWIAARPDATILTVPGRLCFPLLYRTSHRAVWWFTNAPHGRKLDMWKSLFEGGATYPYIAPSALTQAHSAYGAELVIIDKAGATAAAQHWGLGYDLKSSPILFENSRYVALDATVMSRASAA